MRRSLGILRNVVIAAMVVFVADCAAQAKTIYIAVSNPDMSFLSGELRNFKATSRMRGST